MEDHLPLIAGLVGVLVGSVPQVLVQFLQLRANRKRERMAWVLEAAKISHATSVDHARSHQGATFPLAADVVYYQQVYDIIESGKDVPKRLKDAGERQKAVRDSFVSPPDFY